MTTNDADTSPHRLADPSYYAPWSAREKRAHVEREWDDAVFEAANKYVEFVGYSGSVEALAQKMIFIAAANTASRTSGEKAHAALLAGRIIGASLTERGM